MKIKFNILLFTFLTFIYTNAFPIVVFERPQSVSKIAEIIGEDVYNGLPVLHIQSAFELCDFDLSMIVDPITKIQDESGTTYVVFKTKKDFIQSIVIGNAPHPVKNHYCGTTIANKENELLFNSDTIDSNRICFDEAMRLKYMSKFKSKQNICRDNEEIVLGHYPEYIYLANIIEARFFNLPNEIWDELVSKNLAWEINKEFLTYAISLHISEFYLSHNFYSARRNSSFQKELNYLVSNGYLPNTDGCKLELSGRNKISNLNLNN
jgi:hypothetical protein